MSDPSSLNRPLQFYCTAGKGMEQFLAAEVQKKLAAYDVDHVTGKVFFSTSADIRDVLGLKSAERLFLLLRRAPPISQTGKTGRASAFIGEQVIGPCQVWTERLSEWLRLRAAVEEVEPNPRVGRGRKRKLERGEGEVVACEGVVQVEGQGCEQERRSSVDEWQDSEMSKEDLNEKRRGLAKKGCDFGVESLDSGVDRRDFTLEGWDSKEKRWYLGDERQEGQHLGLQCETEADTALTGASDMEAPLPCSDASQQVEGAVELQPAPVSFRVSCRCSGSLSRVASLQDLSRMIGGAVSKQLGWRVDLRDPDLEVSVHLNDDHCVIGLPLLRSPLASRSDVRTTGLRSTVAWVMASLAEIKPGCCVLDPMCGVGTILLEAAKEYANSFFLGTDIDESQLERAGDNVQFAELSHRIAVIKASVMGIPLPSSSVDAVVCDIPFGRKFGNKSDMAACLPTIVKEMERVLRVGGVLVLLLSPALAASLKKICLPPPANPATQPPQPLPHRTGDPPPVLLPLLEFQSSHRVSLGVTDALILKYRKCSISMR
ncbi:hypothetical protein GJAV_G00243250 [Gymnothorax javanicus]|nr:hypothetical protein GJAV_G00243250 [Gymnothorax javanicus]